MLVHGGVIFFVMILFPHFLCRTLPWKTLDDIWGYCHPYKYGSSFKSMNSTTSRSFHPEPNIFMCVWLRAIELRIWFWIDFRYNAGMRDHIIMNFCRPRTRFNFTHWWEFLIFRWRLQLSRILKIFSTSADDLVMCESNWMYFICP